MVTIIFIAALLSIATIAVAIVTSADLVRKKRQLAELEERRGNLMNQMNQEGARRKVVEGNLELAEKARQQKLDLVEEMKQEIEELGGDKDREIGVTRSLEQRRRDPRRR